MNNSEVMNIIGIMAVLKKAQKLQILEAALIYPFLTHQESLTALKNKNIKIESIEQFKIKYPKAFINFNKRFIVLTPTFINSLSMLVKMNLVKIKEDNIYLNEDGKEFLIDKKTMGKAGVEFLKASENLTFLLKSDEVENIYMNLGVYL